MDLALNDKIILVTGGTRGIGRAIVERLLKEGARVAYCARTVPDDIAGATGTAVDMMDGAAITSWVEATATAMGGIDGVIANAGAMAMGDTDEAWEQNLAVDITGLRRIIEAAKPHLVQAADRHGDAAITAVASISGSIGTHSEAYGPIKAALIRYVMGIAGGLAKHNIRANTVSPGTIYFKGGVWQWVEENQAGVFKDTLARNPLGRMGSPEEIADAVVFLTSPRSGFTTGSNLIIDGSLSSHAQI